MPIKKMQDQESLQRSSEVASKIQQDVIFADAKQIAKHLEGTTNTREIKHHKEKKELGEKELTDLLLEIAEQKGLILKEELKAELQQGVARILAALNMSFEQLKHTTNVLKANVAKTISLMYASLLLRGMETPTVIMQNGLIDMNQQVGRLGEQPVSLWMYVTAEYLRQETSVVNLKTGETTEEYTILQNESGWPHRSTRVYAEGVIQESQCLNYDLELLQFEESVMRVTMHELYQKLEGKGGIMPQVTYLGTGDGSETSTWLGFSDKGMLESITYPSNENLHINKNICQFEFTNQPGIMNIIPQGINNRGEQQGGGTIKIMIEKDQKQYCLVGTYQSNKISGEPELVRKWENDQKPEKISTPEKNTLTIDPSYADAKIQIITASKQFKEKDYDEIAFGISTENMYLTPEKEEKKEKAEMLAKNQTESPDTKGIVAAAGNNELSDFKTWITFAAGGFEDAINLNRDIETLQQLTKDLRVIGGVLNLSLEVTVDALKFPNVKKSIENYKEKRDEFKDRKLFPDKAYNWITKEAKNAVKMIPDSDFQEAQQILLELRVMW